MAHTSTERDRSVRATPASGLSARGLARTRGSLARHVERGAVPGLVFAISRSGESHVESIGAMGENEATPVARDTIFRIASMTKPVTAAAAMILVEECRLRLDDPVDEFLPELADRTVLRRIDGPLDDTVPARRPITTRDLLTFRMGHGLVWADPSTHPILKALEDSGLAAGPPAPESMPPPDEYMRRLGKLPLMYQPGERWLYNTGSDVLGVLIARVSGQPFEAFLRERIFGPLGMKDTGFSVPEGKIDRLATSYLTNAETGALDLWDQSRGGQWSKPPAFPSGAGGLVSTADDFLAFGQMMLNRGRLGRERILSRPSVELMTTDHLTPEQKAVTGLVEGYWESHGYGFGVSMVTRRDDLGGSVGQFGWDGGLGTSWASDPQEDLVGVILTQAAFTSPSPPAVVRDFWTSAYAAIED